MLKIHISKFNNSVLISKVEFEKSIENLEKNDKVEIEVDEFIDYRMPLYPGWIFGKAK